MKHSILHLIFMFTFLIIIDVKAEENEFVKTRGVQLTLNGSPFYAHGFNAYWLMYMAADPSQRDKVSSALREASSHGLKIARTWAFSDGGYRPLQFSPGSYNQDMFKGLDFVISEAKKYGIKLVLSLVNNYENLGGKKQYVEWARNQGQSIASEDDFFTNPLVKEFYKNHIKAVLTRKNSITGVAYKDDSSIMAWELMNEARCTSDPSGRTIQGWITEMASYLKSIDGNHLLQAGLEGFYGQSSPQKQEYNPNFQVGTDFISNNLIPGIDFATVHSYPDQWLTSASNEDQFSFLRKWIDVHIQDAQTVLKKPLLFAEFGKSSKDGAEQRDQLFSAMFSSIYSSASSGGAAVGGMFWQLLAPGMDSFRDGYEIILSENPVTTSLITQESDKLNKVRKTYARLKNIENLNAAWILGWLTLTDEVSSSRRNYQATLIPEDGYEDAKIYCKGELVMTTGGTQKEYTVDVWSGNHPYYLGDRSALRFDDDQVEKFRKKYGELTDFMEIPVLKGEIVLPTKRSKSAGKGGKKK